MSMALCDGAASSARMRRGTCGNPGSDCLFLADKRGAALMVKQLNTFISGCVMTTHWLQVLTEGEAVVAEAEAEAEAILELDGARRATPASLLSMKPAVVTSPVIEQLNVN